MGRLAALVLFFLAIAIVVVALQAPASWLAHRLSLAIGEVLDLERFRLRHRAPLL